MILHFMLSGRHIAGTMEQTVVVKSSHPGQGPLLYLIQSIAHNASIDPVVIPAKAGIQWFMS